MVSLSTCCLVNVEHVFIAIAVTSTLHRTGSTCCGPIYESNGKVQFGLLSITLVYKEIEAIIKIPVFTYFEGAEFKFEIRFYLSPLVFLDMHRVHFVHIQYIKAYMNSGLILYLFQFKMGIVQFQMGIVQFKMEKLL